MDPNNPWKNEGFTPQIMGKKPKNEGNVGSHGSVNIPWETHGETPVLFPLGRDPYRPQASDFIGHLFHQIGEDHPCHLSGPPTGETPM